ncbi:MAG: type-F conjugative transfer system secretin TraK [Deltaproteobacteria bacterium]|nr:type-F conjugative transfer system secretin TraK [Deltaproteobacteria bacterium]
MKKRLGYLLAALSALFPPCAYGSFTLPPDSLVRVELSSSDVNRIVCEGGEIKDVVYSKEKGLIVKATGSDAYVKFQVFQKEDKLIYDETPAELYITCGESVYSLIATPAKTPSVTLRLADQKKKIKESAAVFKGLVYEEKVLKFLNMAYTDDIPDVFSIEMPSDEDTIPETRFSSVELRLRRVVRAEGEGLVLKEYRVTPREEIEVREVDFMSLAERPAAIALDSTVMKRGLEYRLFVIDQASGLR